MLVASSSSKLCLLTRFEIESIGEIQADGSINLIELQDLILKDHGFVVLKLLCGCEGEDGRS